MEPTGRPRVVLVTGAGRGIGQRIAAAFAATSCVVHTDLDGDAARLAAEGAGGVSHAMDVRDPVRIRDVVAQVEAEHGPIDVLVNNAGRMTHGPFDTTTGEAFEAMLAVNVTGIFHCVQAVAPRMATRRRGAIVNIASVSSVRGGGAVGNVWYGATKAAVVALTAGLARELGPSGVRVNAISPGLVETDMVRDALTPTVRERALARFPMGRLTAADEVARAALFLASDEAGFVTGQTLAVDGGFLAS